MAELITCPSCGERVPDQYLCPRCGAVTDDFTTSAVQVAPQRVPPPSPEPERPAATACPDASCDGRVPAGATACPECGARVDAAPDRAPDEVAARLELPDGSHVPLRPGARVEVGRDVVDPRIRRGLAGCPTASRRHVALTVDAGTLAVEHLSATNDTYVDGREATGRHVVPLGQGVVVGLGRHVTVRVLPA